MKEFIFNVDPVAKPRMTQRDVWKKRPVVTRYYGYKDILRMQANLQRFKVPESDYHMIFFIAMPKSWSKKKKLEMIAAPHKQTPDKDNLEKGFLDALCPDDSYIWDGRVSKYWGAKGKIIVKVY